ncbi:MAG: transketolase C-terminal domain-containing protein [Propionicimonas sp.]
MTAMMEPREAYAQALLELGAEHDDVVVLDGDCAKANYTNRFGAAHPDRFFNIGISECDIIGTAAGLSLGGKVPFANAYANFLTGRGFDQVRVSVAYSGRSVKIVGHNAGTSAAQEGATHLPLEDFGIMRSLPDVTVLVPADGVEMKKAVRAAYELDGPVYIRVGKLAVPICTDEDTPFEIGKAVLMREGSEVSLVNTGHLLWETLQAAELLAEQGIEAEVLHMHTVKPIDREALVASAAKTGAVVTVEEHSIVNGLGSAVADVLTAELPTPQERVGTKDMFGLSGTMNELLDYFGLRAANIVEAAQQAISRKN